MKIVQVLSCLLYGDAIGNDTLAIKGIIQERGYETQIYADGIAANIAHKSAAQEMSNICRFDKNDIILLHVAIASRLNEWIKSQPCRKVMVWHNITPPQFFEPYNTESMDSSAKGWEQVRQLKDTFDMVLAASEFNKKDLIDIGYNCPIHVLPILIPFNEYNKTSSERLLWKYGNDGFTNIIFVGRIAPNKKQQDVIRAFADYQMYFNPKSRLFLVGNAAGCENYERQLKDYVAALGVRNVHFTGHIKFDEILAYYKLADLFLCQSEHEGFCVPLLEAMYFDVPVVAHESSAIGETLGGGGFLLKGKDSVETAAVMNRILTDGQLRQTVLANQRERLADFQYDKVKALFWKYMDELIEQ